MQRTIIDKLVKSPKPPLPVIPMKLVLDGSNRGTGIQEFEALLDSRLRGSDDLADFLRIRYHYGTGSK